MVVAGAVSPASPSNPSSPSSQGSGTSSASVGAGRILLVIGGTGRVGRAVVDGVRARFPTWHVRVGSRTPSAGPATDAAEAVLFDLDKSDTWQPALAQVRRVCVILPSSRLSDAATLMQPLSRAVFAAPSVKAGVLLSGLAYSTDAGFAPAWLASEHAFSLAAHRAGKSVTVVRSDMFMDNLVDLAQMVKDTSMVALPAPASAAYAPVAVADVGAALAAAACCVSPRRYDRANLVLTGALVSIADIASSLSRIAGCEVGVQEQEDAAFLAAPGTESDPSPFLAEGMLQLWRERRDANADDAVVVSRDLTMLLATREPLSLAHFLARHGAVFGAAPVGVTAVSTAAGLAILRALADAGIMAQALALPGKSESVAQAIAASPATADVPVVSMAVADVDSCAESLYGVSRLVLAPPNTWDRVETVKQIAGAAAKAGVRQIIVVSALAAAFAHTDGCGMFPSEFLAMEAAARDTGVPTIVLRPSLFMENNLASSGSIKSHSAIYSSLSPDTVYSPIALSDMGAAVAALTQEAIGAHTDTPLVLTGPQAVSAADIAAVFTKVLGRRIKAERVTYESAKQRMLRNGMDERQVDAILSLMKMFDKGLGATMTDTFRQLTGRDPIPLSAWVTEAAAVFSGPPSQNKGK